MVKGAWARATPTKNGAIYLAVFNHGTKIDRLVSVKTDVAKKAELHSHTITNGIMKMRQISAVEVHPGEPAVLQPGGSHIMLMGLKDTLSEGEKFPIVLFFENHGELKVEVHVKNAGSMGQDKKGRNTGNNHSHGS